MRGNVYDNHYTKKCSFKEMAAWGGIVDEMWSYMLKIEVTSKSNTFNRIQLM